MPARHPLPRGRDCSARGVQPWSILRRGGDQAGPVRARPVGTLFTLIKTHAAPVYTFGARALDSTTSRSVPMSLYLYAAHLESNVDMAPA